VPIDLPQTAASALASQTQPITVSVDPSGAIFVDEDAVAEADLVNTVTAMAVNGTEDRIFVRGDTASNYGAVMRVMGLLSAAGFNKIGLVTQQQTQ
jgi:biopolymer transport protein TolR